MRYIAYVFKLFFMLISNTIMDFADLKDATFETRKERYILHIKNPVQGVEASHSPCIAVALTKTDAKGTDHKQKIVADIREAIEK